MDSFSRYKGPIVGVALVLLSLIGMFFSGRLPPQRRGGSVAHAFESVIGFFESGFSSVFDTIKSGVDKYTSVFDMVDENRKLKQEIKILKAEIHSYRRLAYENIRLRRLLGYRAKHPELKTIAARVVARALDPHFRVVKLRVAVGPGFKIPSNAAVIAPEGVVGRIQQSYGSYADCLLITDKRSKIPAEVWDKGIVGLLVGTGSGLSHGAVFKTEATSEEPKKGALVVTSGRDGVFPQGLILGRIDSVQDKEQKGYYVSYPVDIAVKLNELTDCLIVTGIKGGQ